MNADGEGSHFVGGLKHSNVLPVFSIVRVL
jgi:hypothetical protein